MNHEGGKQGISLVEPELIWEDWDGSSFILGDLVSASSEDESTGSLFDAVSKVAKERGRARSCRPF